MKGDILMKKLGLIFIFIFLTGLFSGLFFSANLSSENNSYLSSLLLSSFSDSTAGFFGTFFSALTSNLLLIIIMLPALFTKLLCPLPPALLWYKSFAIGFCSGLLYINSADDAFLISILRIFPQNLFLIPAFLVISAMIFYCSVSELRKKSRPSKEKKGLLHVAVLAFAMILAGCLTESVCHAIAL